MNYLPNGSRIRLIKVKIEKLWLFYRRLLNMAEHGHNCELVAGMICQI